MKFLTKIIVPMLLISSCSYPIERVETTVENQVPKETGEIFDNKHLESIVHEYLNFLRSQKNERLHNQKVILAFYKNDSELYLNVYTVERLPFRDTNVNNAKWVCVRQADNNTIYISDDKNNPVGRNFYMSNKCDTLFEDTYDYKFSYDEIWCPNSIWKYNIKGEEFLLLEKRSN